MNSFRHRALTIATAAAVATLGGLAIGHVPAARAATVIHVVNRADDGSNSSLRTAVNTANADGGDVTIQLDGGAPYVINRFCKNGLLNDNHGGDLDVTTTADITFAGPLGSRATIMVSCLGERAVHGLGGGDLTLRSIRITGGNLPKAANGDQSGVLDASNGENGGAIAATGLVVVQWSMIDGNRAADGGNGAPPLFLGAGGRGGVGGYGGAISAQEIEVSDSVITGNESGNGGNGANGVGAGNAGGNGGPAGSGGAFSALSVTVVRSQVANNRAGHGGNGGSGLGAAAPGGRGGDGGTGGAVYGWAASLDGTTLEANVAGDAGAGGSGTGAVGGRGGNAGVGGGVLALGAIVVDSTVHGNIGGAAGPGGLGAPAGQPGDLSFGGGLTLIGGAGSSITFSTVTANVASAAANLRVPVQTTLQASVLGEPHGGGANCSNFITSLGHNVLDTGGCAVAATDLVAPTIDLGPIGANGGGTRTRVPNVGASIVERIPVEECQTILDGDFTDQRSHRRPFGGCEPGSVEIAPTTATKFVPLPPTRVFDTREPGPVTGFVFGGTTRTVQFAGVAGIPPAGATAVAFNLTIDAAAGPGYVSVNPTGHEPQLTSSLNTVEAGQIVPNLVIVPLGDGGRLDFYAQTGGHLLADVVGYFVPSVESHEGRIIPLDPTRVFDTREPGVHEGKVPAAGTITVDVTGVAGVPATGVSAVVLNLTGTEADEAGYVTAYPAGHSRPLASTLNLEHAGHTAANLTIVPIGTDGSVSFYSQSGTHLLADVTGYITAGGAELSAEGLFVPKAPERVFDTRDAGPPLPALGSIDVDTAGTHGIPAYASAAILNVTATEAALAGFVTGWATDEEQPLASTLNVTRVGETRANAALLPIGHDGRISYFTQNGTHLLADVFGYLLPDPVIPIF